MYVVHHIPKVGGGVVSARNPSFFGDDDFLETQIPGKFCISGGGDDKVHRRKMMMMMMKEDEFMVTMITTRQRSDDGKGYNYGNENYKYGWDNIGFVSFIFTAIRLN